MYRSTNNIRPLDLFHKIHFSVCSTPAYLLYYCDRPIRCARNVCAFVFQDDGRKINYFMVMDGDIVKQIRAFGFWCFFVLSLLCTLHICLLILYLGIKHTHTLRYSTFRLLTSKKIGLLLCLRKSHMYTFRLAMKIETLQTRTTHKPSQRKRERMKRTSKLANTQLKKSSAKTEIGFYWW